MGEKEKGKREADEISAGFEEAELGDHIRVEENSNAENEGFLGNGRPEEGTQVVHPSPLSGGGAYWTEQWACQIDAPKRTQPCWFHGLFFLFDRGHVPSSHGDC